MMRFRGLTEAETKLARLDLPAAFADALGVAARSLQQKVVDALSERPGHDHSTPWLQTGALRDSIGHGIDGNVAAVGSTSDVAVDQELGTRTVPPRPFLASTAAGMADDLAAGIAATLVRHLVGN